MGPWRLNNKPPHVPHTAPFGTITDRNKCNIVTWPWTMPILSTWANHTWHVQWLTHIHTIHYAYLCTACTHTHTHTRPKRIPSLQNIRFSSKNTPLFQSKSLILGPNKALFLKNKTRFSLLYKIKYAAFFITSNFDYDTREWNAWWTMNYCFLLRCRRSLYRRFNWQRVGVDSHDDVIKWKYFLRYWPFVRGIHWSPSRLLWRQCNEVKT